MNIKIPVENVRELDGVPLTGAISLAQPTAGVVGDVLQLGWKSYDKKGKVKIWVTTTNNYKTGGQDTYQLLGAVPVSAEKATVSVKGLPAGFYKIVLEAPLNTVNRWVVQK